MVSTPLKNISQLGWLFPIYGKVKHVPKHQPDYIYSNPTFLPYFTTLLRCFPVSSFRAGPPAIRSGNQPLILVAKLGGLLSGIQPAPWVLETLYPLVNCHRTMGNYIFLWENQLFLWPCYAICNSYVKLPEGIWINMEKSLPNLEMYRTLRLGFPRGSERLGYWLGYVDGSSAWWHWKNQQRKPAKVGIGVAQLILRPKKNSTLRLLGK